MKDGGRANGGGAESRKVEKTWDSFELQRDRMQGEMMTDLRQAELKKKKEPSASLKTL